MSFQVKVRMVLCSHKITSVHLPIDRVGSQRPTKVGSSGFYQIYMHIKYIYTCIFDKFRLRRKKQKYLDKNVDAVGGGGGAFLVSG